MNETGDAAALLHVSVIFTHDCYHCNLCPCGIAIAQSHSGRNSDTVFRACS